MNDRYAPTPDTGLLMWRMVRALDVDLAEAIVDDRLSVGRLRVMMRNCAHCPDPRACALFLDARDDRTDQPPSFCPNARDLYRLRATRFADLRTPKPR